MKLAWMYNAYFGLVSWAQDAWQLLMGPVAVPISDFMDTIGFVVDIPGWAYEITVWQLVLGSGFGLWLAITLITWILDIIT